MIKLYDKKMVGKKKLKRWKEVKLYVSHNNRHQSGVVRRRHVKDIRVGMTREEGKRAVESQEKLHNGWVAERVEKVRVGCVTGSGGSRRCKK